MPRFHTGSLISFPQPSLQTLKRGISNRHKDLTVNINCRFTVLFKSLSGRANTHEIPWDVLLQMQGHFKGAKDFPSKDDVE